MKVKKNLFVGFLILAFFGFVAYEMSSALKEDKQSAKKDRIIKFEVDEVSKVHIEYGQMSFEMQKNADQWEILSPAEDIADIEVLTYYLEEVLGQEGREITSDSGETQWSKFGFDDPVGSITVYDKKGKAFKVVVSVQDTFDKQTYIQLHSPNAKPQLFVSSSRWRTLVLKTHEEFQDLSLMAWNQNRWKQLSQLSFTRNSDSFVLAKEGEQWQLRPKAVYPDDSAKIYSFLDDLQKFKAGGFLDESEAQSVAANKPVLSIKVSFSKGGDKDSETQTVSFYKVTRKASSKDLFDYFVYNSLRNKWMGISQEAFEVVAPSTVDFLNFQLDFDIKTAKKLTISGLGIFEHKNNLWVESADMQTKATDGQEFNGAQIIKFLSELKSLKSERFEFDNTPLERKVFRQIEIQGEGWQKKLVVYNQVGSSVKNEDYEDSYLAIEPDKGLPFWISKRSIENLLLIEFYK